MQMMSWSDWQLEKGALQEEDAGNGHNTFLLDQPLAPSHSLKLQFSFRYSGSPYQPPGAANTIIENGSFIRISNYYPRPGYNTDNEIDDPKERSRRNMPRAERLRLPVESSREPFDYGFINFESVISTSRSQTAIGVGELIDQWEKDQRRYPAPGARFSTGSCTVLLLPGLDKQREAATQAASLCLKRKWAAMKASL
jgi:ABC-2 type transport system permease protein